MWVRANPDLFPLEVPGMDADLLARIRQPGGSPEGKMVDVLDAFRNSARHLESLQQVLRKRELQKLDDIAGVGVAVPADVREVIREGAYYETFLSAYHDKSFSIHCDEIVPNHQYRLALEVHTGGPYWSSIPTDSSEVVRHQVETVSASSQVEGSGTVVSQFGSGQRGAVFVWRWQYVPEPGRYDLPSWLQGALSTEGNDPLRKLQSELEALRRWENQVKSESAELVKQGTEIKDPYVREVLKLWPTEVDAQGCQQLKKCAWVEGLDPKLFTGKRVLVHRRHWNPEHVFQLYCTIAQRHQEEPPKETDPPYRLTTTWHWSAQAGAGAQASGAPEKAPQEPVKETYEPPAPPAQSRELVTPPPSIQGEPPMEA